MFCLVFIFTYYEINEILQNNIYLVGNIINYQYFGRYALNVVQYTHIMILNININDITVNLYLFARFGYLIQTNFK